MREMPADMVDGRYRIEHLVARGGFGTVYRAIDLALDRPVALKVLHPELARDANMVARFRREATTLAKLTSPHTLRMYDVGTWGGTLYFVTELLRGASLAQTFEQTGKLPWRMVAEVARGVCASLREAHALGIVHRDLKPANIFLEQLASGDMHVKVLDFGIAKVLESSTLDAAELTQHGQMVGTFDYMAPEQMTGGRMTAASDVFTLGLVMYEMVAGARPFGDANNPAQMLMKLMTQAPAPLTGVPADLARAILACLSREIVQRPNVEQLDAVLAEVLGETDSFDDADEVTMIRATPRPRTPAPVVYASAAGGGGLAHVSPAAPPVITAHPAQVPLPRLPKATPMHGTLAADSLLAQRISHEALAATIASPAFDDALANAGRPAELARGSDAEMPRPPVVQDSMSPAVADESVVIVPAVPASVAVATLRFLILGACLFGLGFLGALVLWSV